MNLSDVISQPNAGEQIKGHADWTVSVVMPKSLCAKMYWVWSFRRAWRVPHAAVVNVKVDRTSVASWLGCGQMIHRLWWVAYVRVAMVWWVSLKSW